MSAAEQQRKRPAPPPRAVLSCPVEMLLKEQAGSEPTSVIDVIIVGSGYGGAVAAARLAGAKDEHGKELTVVVLERGREYLPGDFPDRAALLPGHTRISREGATEVVGVREGLFDLRLGRRVSALVANGLGGGSLINAGLMARPDPKVCEQLLGWQESDGPQERARLEAELEASFARAEQMLGAKQAPDQSHAGQSLAKRDCLATLGRSADQRLEPAAVTIAFRPQHAVEQPSRFSQQLEACVHCGDCFSGCNIGAKKSLDTNYLALAKAREARLYSGATVTHLEPLKKGDHGGARWAVHLELTDEKLARGDREPPPLRARWVILAAGTFGTFEILHRSKQSDQPLASSALGQRFSGNGDSICAVHDPGHDANSVADETIERDKRHVGPTITGLVRARTSDGAAFVVQDLASPAPLQRLFEEVVTTQRMIARIGQFDWSTHRTASDGQDALAIDPEVIRQTALYAAMGDDGAAGSLNRSDNWTGEGGVFAHWPAEHKPSQRLYDAQIAWLRSAVRGRRATLIPNPLWQPLPEALTTLFGDIGRGLMTVHPLGGCGMGHRPEQAVVDFSGRVFEPGPSFPDGKPRIHKGLLIVDGSVLPGAVGINPALTIVALAERTIARLMTKQRWAEADRIVELDPQPLLPPTAARLGTTGIDFKERMEGRIRPLGSSNELKATVSLAAEPIDDLLAFLRKADRTIRFSTADLKLSGDAGDVCVSLQDAQLQVLVRGRSSVASRLGSALKALWINRRHDLFRGAWYRFARRPLASLRKFRVLLAFATHVGERRHLIYRFNLPADVVIDGRKVFGAGTQLTGVKTIEYAADANPWEQLMQLSLHQGDDKGPVIGTLDVDLGYFAQVQQPLISLTAQRDQPSALLDLLSFGLFIGRVLAKIHFWSFRMPDDVQRIDDDSALRARRLPQCGLGEQRFEVKEPRSGGPPLTLSIYTPAKAANPVLPPVVLFHGFSASGATFAHAAIPNNMVQVLLKGGRQVWVADLRTSIGHRNAALEATDFGQVARDDITTAIDEAFRSNNKKPVDVIAHCIGAAMFCQAVMGGRLRYGGRSMVRAAVLSQTTPFIRMKPQNQLRAYLAMYLRHFLTVETLDPLNADFAGMPGNIIDLLLSTFPYPMTERARMSGRHGPAPYALYRARTDAVFGQLFKLEHVAEPTLAALPDLLGEINLDAYAQTIHWARRGLLTDMFAARASTTAAGLSRFDFPMMVLHGSDSELFDPEASELFTQTMNTMAAPATPSPYKLEVVPGYGHQDPFIGKDSTAARTKLRDFLNAAPPAPQFLTTQLPAAPPDAPTVGPVLGWLRHTDDGLHLRLLAGEHLYAQSTTFQFEDAGGHTVPSNRVWPIRNPNRLAVYDVQWPAGNELRITTSGRVSVGNGARGIASTIAGAGLTQAQALGRARGGVVQLSPRVLAAADQGAPAPACALRSLSFAMASCSQPPQVFDRELAQRSLGRLLQRLEEDSPPQFLLLLGDQIYADSTANLADPRLPSIRYRETTARWMDLPKLRDVLRRLPTHMMLDDHELDDQYEPGMWKHRTELKWYRNTALSVFHQWQRLVGTDFPFNRPQQKDYNPWSVLYPGGYPLFILNTRTQRSRRSYRHRKPLADRTRATIIDSRQADELEGFLRTAQDIAPTAPKFIASPSVVFPEVFMRSQASWLRSDGWGGFEDSARRLIDFIDREKIDHVVFLSGDYHASAVASATTLGGRRLLSIISSGLYAPYPFANAQLRQFVTGAWPTNSATPLANVTVHRSTDRDGFAVVEVTPPCPGATGPSLAVTFHYSDGGKESICLS